MYPPPLHRRPERSETLPQVLPASSYSLSYMDPRTWRTLVRQMHRWRPDALIVPWFHPVMALPFAYFLEVMPRVTTRVVICHNVVPHEEFLGWRRFTRPVFGRADLLVVHAATQRKELRELGVNDVRHLELFHPRFPHVVPEAVESEVEVFRRQLGEPRLLALFFGLTRRYKGVDLAIAAIARLIAAGHDAKLVIAGRILQGAEEMQAQISQLGLQDRIVIFDEHVSDSRAAVLFGAADVTVLPYRSASQSGVVQLSFAHGCPVVASAIGGLSTSIRDGVDGLLCVPNDLDSLTHALMRMLAESEAFRKRVDRSPAELSFDRYAERLLAAIRATQHRNNAAG